MHETYLYVLVGNPSIQGIWTLIFKVNLITVFSQDSHKIGVEGQRFNDKPMLIMIHKPTQKKEKSHVLFD